MLWLFINMFWFCSISNYSTIKFLIGFQHLVYINFWRVNSFFCSGSAVQIWFIHCITNLTLIAINKILVFNCWEIANFFLGFEILSRIQKVNKNIYFEDLFLFTLQWYYFKIKLKFYKTFKKNFKGKLNWES